MSYCTTCKSMHGPKEPCVPGDLFAPENLESYFKQLDELRTGNKSFSAHCHAFWERIRTITKGNAHANHR